MPSQKSSSSIKICLHHQSVTPFLNGAPPPKKNPGSAPEIQLELRKGLEHGIGSQDKVKIPTTTWPCSDNDTYKDGLKLSQ